MLQSGHLNGFPPEHKYIEDSNRNPGSGPFIRIQIWKFLPNLVPIWIRPHLKVLKTTQKLYNILHNNTILTGTIKITSEIFGNYNGFLKIISKSRDYC
jgi:hypothetical protein